MRVLPLITALLLALMQERNDVHLFRAPPQPHDPSDELIEGNDAIAVVLKLLNMEPYFSFGWPCEWRLPRATLLLLR